MPAIFSAFHVLAWSFSQSARPKILKELKQLKLFKPTLPLTKLENMQWKGILTSDNVKFNMAAQKQVRIQE